MTSIDALAARLRALEDRLLIADAYARYAVALDERRRDLLADVFDEDTEFACLSPEVPARVGVEGNWLRLMARHAAADFRERHVTGAPVILKLEADRCEAVAECVILRVEAGARAEVEMVGMYHDTLVRKDDRWVFRSRRFVPDR